MNKTQWYKDAVIYQIYPRSFCDSNGDGIGDIRGIISKLDYVKSLGVDAVWLSPCYKSPNDDNGYDISDYRDIMDEFGTLDDWKEMIAGMHERGIKLIMDLVVNHSSDEHRWFAESKAGNPEYRDYYIWKKGRGKDGRKPPNNWVSRFGGSAWSYDEASGEHYLHLFTKKQPDLNWDNPKVRQEVADLVTFWLDLGVDGFRCDVITYISKVEGYPSAKGGGDAMFTHGPNIHAYLNELYRRTFSKYDCMTVGEAAGVTTDEALLYTGEGREELDTVFQFEQFEINAFFRVVPRKFNLVKTKEVFARWQNDLHGKGWNSLYIENHDQPRIVSQWGSESFRKESAKLWATALYFQQGTPYIYQGQEIGMTNIEFRGENDHADVMAKTVLSLVKKYVPFLKRFALKKLALRSRDNGRTPMQWNAKENAGFTTGTPWYRVNPNYKTINVEEALGDENSILNYIRKMLTIRKGNQVVKFGTYKDLCPADKQLYVYEREYNGDKLLAVCNCSDKETDYKLQITDDKFGEFKNLILSNYNKPGYDEYLKPWECRVYSNK